MRIVFVNLQGNEKLVKSPEKYIFKTSVAKKHRYILDELLRREIPVCNYISSSSGRPYPLVELFYRLIYPLRLILAPIILKKDGILPRQIKTLHRLTDIEPDDIVLLYGFKDEFPGMDKVTAFKAGCLLHSSCGSNYAKVFKKANVQCFYNEANLRKTGKMFRYYYRDVPGEILVIPFVFEKRFQSRTPFSQRQNKAIAVGTITYRKDKEFLDMYGDSCLQPLRKEARDAAPQMTAYYDSVMSDYGEGVKEKVVRENDGVFKRAYKVLWNMKHIGQQKHYFSFDMVEKLNQYKMCICAEEVIGVPGIGFVEGMACGCAYIGCRHYDYAAYGMVEGKHYIGYDGTLDDLREKIAYYQSHEDELAQIANAGHEFALEHFSAEAVTTTLLDGLLARKKAYEDEQRSGKSVKQEG